MHKLQRLPNCLNEVQKQYIAGFIDSNGKISAITHKRTGYNTVYISITDTEVKDINDIYHLLLVGSIMDMSADRWRVYRYMILGGASVYLVLQQVSGYLVKSHNQAMAAIELCELLDNGAGTNKVFYPERQLELVQEIKTLNKRSSGLWIAKRQSETRRLHKLNLI